MSRRTPEPPFTPHETVADWRVDAAGVVWARERRFGCPNHPHGPPDVDDDAVRKLVAGVWDELGSAAAVATVAGVSAGVANEAWEQLGLCCRSHRWRDTGELREVSTLELLIRTNMPRIWGEHAQSLDRSILLAEVNRAFTLSGKTVHVPLLVHAGARLPKSGAAQAYDLHNPGAPPTPKET